MNYGKPRKRHTHPTAGKIGGGGMKGKRNTELMQHREDISPAKNRKFYNPNQLWSADNDRRTSKYNRLNFSN
jgi:hypothetical protein